MSGICGLVRFDEESVSETDLNRQMRALAHRGPDRAKTWRGGSAGLGALMMRVTLEDALDQQPLRDAQADLTFVSDARIDNREAVAEALGIAGDRLAEMADSALLFAAYRAWGEACPERLVGDFVFAAWDARARTLTLARDHMGQRQVYFHAGEGFFVFASEKKGLWATPDVPRTLSDAAIADGLTMGLGRRRTFETARLDEVGWLPGGSVLTLDALGEVSCRRYWTPRADPIHENRDEAYYVEAYRRVLGEAVACRLRRNTASAGLFMSGGFDSTAICALSAPAMEQQGRRLVAVASVMPDGYAGTIHHARPWVEAAGRHMPHVDVRYVTREGLDIFTSLEKGFLENDGPHSSNWYVQDAILAEIAAAGARTAMDGHGGDYTLNPQGVDTFIALLAQGRIGRFVSEWRARRRFVRASHWAMLKGVLLRPLTRSMLKPWRRYRNGLAPWGGLPLAKAFMRASVAPVAGRRGRGALSMRGAAQRVLDLVSGGPGAAVSIPAAHRGLEFTQPFHDKRVVELALAIPEDLYMKNGRERHLARTALKDVYPPELLERRPGNDDLGPDFLMMAKSVEPRVLAEIDRMEAAGKLTRYFDFPRMRRMLTRRTVDQHNSGSEYDVRQAHLTFLRARYIEWFRGDNR